MTPEMQASFLKLPTERRIGTIAVNANRIARVLSGQNTIEGTRALISENMQFIEWTAPALKAEQKFRLAEYQQTLGNWRRSLAEIVADQKLCDEVQKHSRGLAEEFFGWTQEVGV